MDGSKPRKQSRGRGVERADGENDLAKRPWRVGGAIGTRTRGSRNTAVALTIGCIARYRSPALSFARFMSSVSKDSGHFYSIEIMSTSQLLCSSTLQR